MGKTENDMLHPRPPATSPPAEPYPAQIFLIALHYTMVNNCKAKVAFWVVFKYLESFFFLYIQGGKKIIQKCIQDSTNALIRLSNKGVILTLFMYFDQTGTRRVLDIHRNALSIVSSVRPNPIQGPAYIKIHETF